MVEIGDKIVALDVFKRKFVCDLSACKGACCVEGDSGAPLEEDELAVIESVFEDVKPYMRKEGVEAVEKCGPYEVDGEGDYVTPLVNGKECAYVIFDENGITKCSIEKAYEEGKIDYKKPISCHLYPIRVNKLKEFYAVNYSESEICDDACVLGEKLQVKTYRFLREPIIRKFGKEFYSALEQVDLEIEKEVKKGVKRFGEDFDKEQFLATNPNVLRNKKKIEEVNDRMKLALNANDLEGLRQLIIDLEIADPISGTKNWTEVKQFNLMFETEIGAVAGEASKIYLRPETAQGIFVNFLNVQKTGRMKIPFGIAQIGKAFRNEIVARQFIFRMREFEQMEMQFFVKPGTEGQWYDFWKEQRINWHKALGFEDDAHRFHDHLKLAHYANAACDIEFNFPMGFKELEGIHSRGNFDLTNHSKFSGKKLQYFDPQDNKSYVPYVIETSIGLDRMFLAILSNCLKDEVLEDGSERVVLRIPPALAPIKVAVLPLLKKDGLPDIAHNILNDLKYDFNCQYDEKDAIGRRYRRHDAIGTPYCITVDHQTLEDNTVTIRERDSMKQRRINISEIPNIIREKVSMTNLLKNNQKVPVG